MARLAEVVEISERPGLAGADAPVDLGRDPSAAARADARAPLDADLRQQPPRSPSGSPRRSTSSPARRSSRAHHGSLARAAARRDRGRAQGRPPARRSSPPPRSSSASTWARSISSSRSRRRRRSRAACSASAARVIRSGPRARAHLPEVPRRPGGLRRGRRAMHEGARRGDTLPAQPARRARAADRRDGGDGRWDVDELFALVRQAAPFADARSRASSTACSTCSPGRYPSDEFAELRRGSPGIACGTRSSAREGAKRVAIANGGTIPDRGLYGVFLAGAAAGTARVGELDEEMVFESRVGETFLLGASTWRIEEITHDRVLVSPAPGEPGKMPFWKGERPGARSSSGARIGALVRELRELPRGGRARAPRAASTTSTRGRREPPAVPRRPGAPRPARVPDDRTIVIERCRDELGDWRVCLLSPLGGRVLRPGAMAVVARPARDRGLDVETMWTDDGFVVRFPEIDEPPDPRLLLPRPGRVEALVLRQLGGDVALRRHVPRGGRRARCCCRGGGPAAARRSGSSASAPRTCWPSPRASARSRCCSRRTASACATCSTCPRWCETLRAVARARHPRRHRRHDDAVAVCRLAAVRLRRELPLRRRRAAGRAPRAGADHRPGAAARAARRRRAARAARPPTRSTTLERAAAVPRPSAIARAAPTACTTCCSGIGDLSREELAARCARPDVPAAVDALVRARRALAPRRSRASRASSPSRMRRATATRWASPLPPGCRRRCSRRCATPLARSRARGTRARTARSRPPTRRRRFGARRAGGRKRCCARAGGAGRLLEGEFRPGGHAARVVRAPTCCARSGGGRSRRLRHEVEPVEPRGARPPAHDVAGRDARRGAGLDALLDADRDACRARRSPPRRSSARSCRRASRATQPGDLDALLAAGEVVWAGVEPLGERDGRIALFLTDTLAAPVARRRRRRTPSAAASGAIARLPARAGRVVLRRAARGRRRRLPARHGGRALGARVAGPGHQRHAPARCAPTSPRRRRRRRARRGAPRVRASGRVFRSRRRCRRARKAAGRSRAGTRHAGVRHGVERRRWRSSC